MTDAFTTKSNSATGRLFVLGLSGGCIYSMSPEGADRKLIVADCPRPDEIAVDVAAGHLYWTNIGVYHLHDGGIERADLDGQNRKVIVPEGSTPTLKRPSYFGHDEFAGRRDSRPFDARPQPEAGDQK